MNKSMCGVHSALWLEHRPLTIGGLDRENRVGRIGLLDLQPTRTFICRSRKHI